MATVPTPVPATPTTPQPAAATPSSTNTLINAGVVPATPWHVFMAYVKLHETFIGLVLAGLLLWCVLGKIDNAIAVHDNKNLAAAQAVTTAQVATVKQEAAAAQAQAAAYA